VDRIAESPHETWMVGNYLGKTQDGPQEDWGGARPQDWKTHHQPRWQAQADSGQMVKIVVKFLRFRKEPRTREEWIYSSTRTIWSYPESAEWMHTWSRVTLSPLPFACELQCTTHQRDQAKKTFQAKPLHTAYIGVTILAKVLS
jgi:hypothetical protein